jgi:hypothetical protein
MLCFWCSQTNKIFLMPWALLKSPISLACTPFASETGKFLSDGNWMVMLYCTIWLVSSNIPTWSTWMCCSLVLMCNTILHKLTSLCGTKSITKPSKITHFVICTVQPTLYPLFHNDSFVPELMFWYLFQVHPEHMCYLWWGFVWGAWLAFQQHCQQCMSAI